MSRTENPVRARRCPNDATRSKHGTLVYALTLATSANMFVKGQAAYMREQGWNVHVVTAPGPETALIQQREGVHTHNVPMRRNPSPVWDVRALFSLIREYRKIKPDVVVSSTPKAGLLSSLAAWATRVPVRIYLLRGLRYEGGGSLARSSLRLIEKLVVASSTHTVVISPSLADKFVSDGLGHARPYLLGQGSGNGIPAKEIADRVQTHRNAGARLELLGDRANDFVILFLGRHVRDKGIHHLLSAASDLDGVTVLSAGPDTENLHWAEEFRAPHLHWVCHSFSEDITRYLAASDILVLPTRREGMGNVLLEAQAAGLPVVAYDVTGAKDAVRADQTGFLVPYGDLDALASSIRLLKNDPVARSTMGSAGASWVAEAFNPRELWARYDDLFRSLLHSKGRSS